MRKLSLSLLTMLGLLTLSSCAMPGIVSNPNNCYPQSVTETHTKTTLVAPPSYNMPYLPPAAIYQTAPAAAPMPMQAPQCQPVYQAPQAVYQAAPCQQVQYQAYQDPCAPQQSGYFRSPNPYYSQPHATVTTSTNVVPLGAPQAAVIKSDRCEESK